jgi:hypothetical protein
MQSPLSALVPGKTANCKLPPLDFSRSFFTSGIGHWTKAHQASALLSYASSEEE